MKVIGEDGPDTLLVSMTREEFVATIGTGGFPSDYKLREWDVVDWHYHERMRRARANDLRNALVKFLNDRERPLVAMDEDVMKQEARAAVDIRDQRLN